MLHAKRTIPITGLLFFASWVARGGDGVWTRSGPSVEIRSLAADSAEPETVYAATSDSVLVSADGGGSWTLAGNGLRDVTSLVSDPARSFVLFAATETGLFESTDAGASFAATTFPGEAGARAVAIDSTGRALLCASRSGNRLMRSDDGGASWRSAVPPTASGRIAALLLHPDRSALAFAGVEGDMSYYPIAVAGSTTGGLTWKSSRFYAYGLSAAVLAIGPGERADLRPIYAGLYGVGGSRVIVSLDGGLGWKLSPLMLQTRISSLAVDRSGNVYAGTGSGVLLSRDRGLTWSPLNAGLDDLHVTSLAIESGGRRIHAGTRTGVFDLDLVAPPHPAGPCVADAEHLCLLGRRFRVRLTARNLRTGVAGPGAANPEGDRFGFFALPEFTGDAAFPEVLVKMVDATGLSGRSFWFFYSGLTSLPYEIEVEDTTTGELRTYQNSPENPFCGGADTALFPVGDGAEAESFEKASTLPEAEGASLLLLEGRFEVTVSAFDARRNRTSAGAAIPWGDRAGYFSLPDFTGDSSFPEVFVKMVDYTSVSGEYWFFYTGLTHLPYTLTVTDRLTGISRSYESPGPFCGQADTAAFDASGIPDLPASWTATVRHAPEAEDDLCRREETRADATQHRGRLQVR